ncbi:uncharacterized protein TNCV_1678551 [Trichonephila clavipes]|nr:uncharacterized protein TNCV_1678551 [Trichonephila clavipes]
MRRVSAKVVPRFLTEDQQFQRLVTSSDLFQSASDDPEFMKLIITGDELWVYGYDLETKLLSSQWKTPGSPRPKKARSIESTKTDWNCTRKSIFTCFAQTSDRLPRLTQTYPIMPDVMDMIESDID